MYGIETTISAKTLIFVIFRVFLTLDPIKRRDGIHPAFLRVIIG